MAVRHCILFHDRDKLQVGSVFRYRIEIESAQPGLELYLNISNRAVAPMRAAYLSGPFTLYADVIPMDYSELVKTPPGAEPKYENHVKAGGNFLCTLKLLHSVQSFEVTIASEILFTRGAEIGFDVVLASSHELAQVTSRKKVEKFLGSDARVLKMRVTKQNTSNLWQLPTPKPDKPLHLCVLTHGLVSNVTADLLYLKEAIDAAATARDENLVCKGFTGNACRTEHGVKYLGKRLARWLANELIPTFRPAKMSFIAHSLGGVVQTYALGYLRATRPHIFDGIRLENFITLASPYLGISHENPGYVQFVLDFGFVGKTGRDLGLSWSIGSKQPLLARLPNKYTRKILRRFVRRTLYANAINDGIVPLRTAALLYLDWRALARVENAESEAYERMPRSQELVVKTLKSIMPDKSDERLLKHFQTSTFEDGADLGSSKDLDAVVERLPKKTSIIESGMSLLLPPHPDTEFIADPAKRTSVVFHDRVYFERDLPPKRFKSKLSLAKGEKELVETARLEEKIARKYHHRMSWRKVLVKLQPEAHNNIIVRRRFSNAYGWPVVKHLVCEHFLVPAAPDMYEDLRTQHPDNTDSASDDSSDDMPWSESEDEGERGTHVDPHRPSMFRIKSPKLPPCLVNICSRSSSPSSRKSSPENSNVGNSGSSSTLTPGGTKDRPSHAAANHSEDHHSDDHIALLKVESLSLTVMAEASSQDEAGMKETRATARSRSVSLSQGSVHSRTKRVEDCD